MTAKRCLLIGYLSFLCVLGAFAQQKEGSVEVVQDPLITVLQQHRVAFENNQETLTEHRSGEKGTMLGFRIQIYTGTSRNDAYEAQAKFKNMYADISTYISYTQPNYRVKIGDFRSRSEAEEMMRELRKSFDPIFLFTEQVNVIY